MRRQRLGGRPPAARLGAALAALALLPLALLAYSGVRLSANAVEREVEARIGAAAELSASAIQREMQGLADVVTSYAGRPHLVDAVRDPSDPMREAVRAHLRELRMARPGIATAFLADLSGRLIDIVPETPSIVGDDFGHRDWYRGVIEGDGAYVSEAYKSLADGQPLVVAAADLVGQVDGDSGEGEPVAILVAAYDLSTIQGFVERFAASQDVLLRVTDQRGVLVAAPGVAPTALVSGADDPIVLEALAGASGVIEHEGPAGLAVSAYVPVPRLGWTVTASVPHHQAYAGVARIRTTVTAVALVIAAVLVGVLGLVIAGLRGRRSAEEARARLAAIVESSDDAIISNSLDGRITSWNRGAERLYGYTAEEAVGRPISMLVPADDPDEISRILTRLEAGERIEHYETVRLREDGRRLDVSLTISPVLDHTGEVVGAATIARDITRRRRDDEELRRARADAEAARAEAERASYAKSDFLSRMSHELRTPLNAILGFAQLLEMDHLDEQQKEAVQQILRGGRHLLDLINEILELSRIEAGRITVSIEPVAVRPVLEEVADLVAPLAEDRGMSIALPDVGHDVHMVADRQRLKQVVLNLLSNAIKYGSRGSVVRVACGEQPGDRLRLSFADSGPGIPRERLAHLFTPFERLGAEHTGVEGTGLGLALSKRLTEAMSGTIGVESEPGRGSVFFIDLMAAAAPERTLDELEGVALETLDASISAMTILYIEDNLSNLSLVERILLHRPGVRLLAAMQGRLGIDLAVEHQPDLVLLDLHLPDMHGVEALRALRADPRTADVPVVAVTADATPRERKRLLAAGVVEYLTKPLDVRKFLEVVDAASSRAVGRTEASTRA